MKKSTDKGYLIVKDNNGNVNIVDYKEFVKIVNEVKRELRKGAAGKEREPTAPQRGRKERVTS